jgi:hypothetical protein
MWKSNEFYFINNAPQFTVIEFQPLLPPLYLITPTYRRPEQLAELTRLGYLLRNVLNLHWLVIEDAEIPSAQVTKVLQRINIPFSHIIGEFSNDYAPDCQSKSLFYKLFPCPPKQHPCQPNIVKIKLSLAE